MGELILLKLGGSLITDKGSEYTPRRDVLARLAEEILAGLSQKPGLHLVLGHGSGSFGHVPAKKYGTRQGVRTAEEWRGFVEVWKEARALNNIVLDSFLAAGLPVIAFPPSGAVIARDGNVLDWPLQPIQAALDAGLLPVINGDTIFDTVRGGTILSTEDLFIYLARNLKPQRILLAGIEDGVWLDYPTRSQLVQLIIPDDYAKISPALAGSAAVDVTGGMAQKVKSMMDLVHESPGLQVLIFSGQQPGVVQRAILGESPGTIIQSASR